MDGSGRELTRWFETRVSVVLVLFTLWSVPALSGAQQVLRAPRDPPTFYSRDSERRSAARGKSLEKPEDKKPH